MTTKHTDKKPQTGDVPAEVWKRFKRRFHKLESVGYFWPCDGRDAYQQTAYELIRAAAKPKCLKKASPLTYLTSVMRISLFNFHKCNVIPLREEYRRVERKVLGIEEKEAIEGNANAPEGADVGREIYAQAAESGSDEVSRPMTAQQLAEALPGFPWARERYELAKSTLEDIFSHLPKEIVRAFRGYLKADGNFVRAAKFAHIGVNRYYRTWPKWIAAARAVGEKIALKNH